MLLRFFYVFIHWFVNWLQVRTVHAQSFLILLWNVKHLETSSKRKILLYNTIYEIWSQHTTRKTFYDLLHVIQEQKKSVLTKLSFCVPNHVRKSSKKITAMFCATLKKEGHEIWIYVGWWLFTYVFANTFFFFAFLIKFSTLFICLFYIHEQHMFLHVSNDLFVSINILCCLRKEFFLFQQVSQISENYL